MADRRRAELAESVTDACEGLTQCGFLGLMETPVLKVFSELHKLHDTEQLSNLIAALEDSAARMMSRKAAPSFPELMVLSQLLLDVEGPAAPPEGADSPLDSEFRSLSANLRLALCTALQQFARKGSEEAQQGLDMATGMLLMLHEKVAGDQLVTLAVEHAMLRLLHRAHKCVLLMRDRTWALAALNKQIAELKEYKPDENEAAEGEGDEEMEEEDDDDDDDDEELDEEDEVDEEVEDEEGDAEEEAAGGDGEGEGAE
ncbi:hypothetical protein Agub_g2384 [Astrephomene gubernaculifera]|uniref:Uncharacterized protein n=1 Tax=Astrephomene gubernaculifera TaxID=47775 RepID=A0AAD3HI24_9CHLO|nr:hypothetical protein Agub_g2384 [Astrephomene gubernaculifera]